MIRLGRGRIRPLLFAFLLTSILFCFLLALFWVQLQAARGDFSSLDRPTAVLKASPEPLLLVRAGSWETRVPLGWLDRAAGVFQMLDRWIMPAELRFSVRAGLLAKDLAGQAHGRRLEREFYRNAGGV